MLTKREREILQLVAEGHSNSQLARMLWVTEQTVKFHLSNIYRKLDVANRTEASRWAQIHGLLEPAAGRANGRRADRRELVVLRLIRRDSRLDEKRRELEGLQEVGGGARLSQEGRRSCVVRFDRAELVVRAGEDQHTWRALPGRDQP